MPPKKKYNQDTIVSVACDVFEEEGMDKVTARSISVRMNCSTQPVFSYFSDMQRLRDAIEEQISQRLEAAILSCFSEPDQLRSVCKAVIRFARQNPRGYSQVVLTREPFPFSSTLIESLIESEKQIIASDNEARAASICYDALIYVFGLANLSLRKDESFFLSEGNAEEQLDAFLDARRKCV